MVPAFRVSAKLAECGPTYQHCSGHRIGAAPSAERKTTPCCEVPIEEGIVSALGPSICEPGWRGVRLGHAFHVGADGDEIPTRLEHAP